MIPLRPMLSKCNRNFSVKINSKPYTLNPIPLVNVFFQALCISIISAAKLN